MSFDVERALDHSRVDFKATKCGDQLHQVCFKPTVISDYIVKVQATNGESNVLIYTLTFFQFYRLIEQVVSFSIFNLHGKKVNSTAENFVDISNTSFLSKKINFLKLTIIKFLINFSLYRKSWCWTP